MVLCSADVGGVVKKKKKKRERKHGVKGRVEQGFAAMAVVLKGQLREEEEKEEEEEEEEGSVRTDGGGETLQNQVCGWK